MYKDLFLHTNTGKHCDNARNSDFYTTTSSIFTSSLAPTFDQFYNCFGGWQIEIHNEHVLIIDDEKSIFLSRRQVRAPLRVRLVPHCNVVGSCNVGQEDTSGRGRFSPSAFFFAEEVPPQLRYG